MSYKYYIDEARAICSTGPISDSIRGNLDNGKIEIFETNEEIDFGRQHYHFKKNENVTISVSTNYIKKYEEQERRFKYKVDSDSISELTNEDVFIYLPEYSIEHESVISVNLIIGNNDARDYELNANSLKRVYEYCIDSIDGLKIDWFEPTDKKEDIIRRLKHEDGFKLKFERFVSINKDSDKENSILVKIKDYDVYMSVIKKEVKLFNGLDYECIYAEECEREKVEEKVEEKEKKIIWSGTKIKKINFLKSYLTDQVRVRYAMFERPKNGTKNNVIDSFIPRLFVANEMNSSETVTRANLPKTSVAISEWFCDVFSVKQMQFEQMCLFLGYTKKDIKNLLIKAKKEQYNITFIGYGGTNVNTIHWLLKMCEMTGISNIFKYAEVYENDKADISNLFRFPMNVSKKISTTNGYKLDILGEDLNMLSTLKPMKIYGYYRKELYQTRNFIDMNYEYKEYTDEEKERIENGEYIHKKLKYDSDGRRIINYKKKDNIKHIFYGAPDIGTRESLSELGGFISATHGSNNCSLSLNPMQDSAIQVESYGMIQLSQFFMNQLRMAIGLLEVLSDTSLDLNEKDKQLMEYRFDGNSRKQCDRQYRFDMSFNGQMIDQQQAENI